LPLLKIPHCDGFLGYSFFFGTKVQAAANLPILPAKNILGLDLLMQPLINLKTTQRQM
jgi:hypothetical protein